jgi:energy-coupling factor transporter ATP-binding protein EcfA2
VIPGVSMANFLRMAVTNTRNARFEDAAANGGHAEKMTPREFRRLMKEKMSLLKMDDSFATRYLNEGFSGGEKKRAEILQMALLEPTMAILDETDSGLDIDALRVVSDGVNALANESMGVLLITHYQRLLNHIKPQFVHIMMNGRIVQRVGRSWPPSSRRRVRGASRAVGAPASGPDVLSQLRRITRGATQCRQVESTGIPVRLPDDGRLLLQGRAGLNRRSSRDLGMKAEPAWMLDPASRPSTLRKRPMPKWGGNLDDLDFGTSSITSGRPRSRARPGTRCRKYIKNTFEKLGIPEAERKFLAGVGAQYESEVIYHSLREDLQKQGVVFLDMDAAVHEYPELVKQYFGTIIPANDNKFAALNSAVWSGGSFIYVPEGVKVEVPLQAYFRINAENMGQFERTLIICAPNSYVHYVEGCTAPTYNTNSLHSAVVEIIVQEGARCRYTTIQNWSKNVYNLVTKRAAAYKNATMEWVDGNLGSKLP